tara:strand:+ start:854 stop:1474 length:621 start_codon:yes stop_codon:yes gene_type:complete
MMRNNESFNPSGHLEIYKIYNDGTEECVFEEANTITSGMGVGLGLLYAGSGSQTMTDFQIRYMQLGTSGDSVIDTYGVSQYSLVSAFGQENGITDYGINTTLPMVLGSIMDWDGSQLYDSESKVDKWVKLLISDNAIKRVDLNSVTYILYADKNTCNEQIVNEIGLFMQNPLNQDPELSPMVAYRPFISITKTSDFSLLFKWTLNF